MKLSHQLSLMAAIAVLASTNLSAQAPTPKQQAFWIRAKAELELDRDKLRVDLADMQYKIEFAKYTAGTGPVSNVLDAADEALRKGLTVGDGGHSIAYEKRIKELESIATRNLGQGTGTQHELELVRAARLDSVLRRLLKDAADPNNG